MNQPQDYQELCAELYQVLGELDAPAHVLDKVLAAANGEPIPDIQLLPFVSPEKVESAAAVAQPASAISADVRVLLERSEGILGSQGFSAWDELAGEIRAKLAEATPPPKDELGRVYDLIGLHRSQPLDVLLVNVENMKRFTELLGAVEREFFMVPGEPSGEPEDEGCEPDDECLVNRWGSSLEEYIEQFREALKRVGPQYADASAVLITNHLDEIDAPAWDFINSEAAKVGGATGHIDRYSYERANGGVVVLWNGHRLHAVALTFRDDLNRTRCIRVLATPQREQASGSEHNEP